MKENVSGCFFPNTVYIYANSQFSPTPSLFNAPLRRTHVKLPNNLRCSKTRVLVLASDESCMIVGLSLLILHHNVVDRQTDRQTDKDSHDNTYQRFTVF